MTQLRPLCLASYNFASACASRLSPSVPGTHVLTPALIVTRISGASVFQSKRSNARRMRSQAVIAAVQVRAGQGERELLAAIARDRIDRAALVSKQCRGFAEHGISDGVAEAVVDQFEAIQIEHRNRKWRSEALCALDFFA